MTESEPTKTPTKQTKKNKHKKPTAEMAGMVARVFESVAPRYDLMYVLLAGGVHRLW